MSTRGVIAVATSVFVMSVAGTALTAGWYFGREIPPEGAVATLMRSDVLGESREIIVHPPENYADEPDRRYPVIYVLDGSSQDVHTARTAALLARIGQMPPAIVVGLPNVSGEGRQRDYTPPFMRQDSDEADSESGRGDRFLEFLKREVVPQIERTYRTTAPRMLAGHSRGGLLVTYSLMHEPDLFQARIANSPALFRDDTIIAARLDEYLSRGDVPESFFFMSMGGKEVPHMVAAFEQVRDVLAAKAPPALTWRADRIPGADHQHNGEWATPAGLAAFFGLSK
jgi:predicted alpha/beta superfamily hydrolase